MKNIFKILQSERNLLSNVGKNFLDGFLEPEHELLQSPNKRQRLRIYNGITLFLIVNIFLFAFFHSSVYNVDFKLIYGYLSIIIIFYILNVTSKYRYFEFYLALLIIIGLALNFYTIYVNLLFPPFNYLSMIVHIVMLHLIYSRIYSFILIIILSLSYFLLLILRNSSSRSPDLYLLNYFYDFVFNSLLLWFLLEIYSHFRKELEYNLKQINLTRENDIQLASEIQKQLLPANPVERKNLKIEYFIMPYHKVSGDFVEIIQENENFFVFFADTMGHGVQSGILTMQIHSLITYLLIEKKITDIFDIYLEINNHYYQTLKKLEIKSFIYLTILKVNPSGTVYVIGTQNNIYHYDSNYNLKETLQHYQLLGLEYLQSKTQIVYSKIQLQKNEFLFLCSDGLYEIFIKNNLVDHEKFLDLLSRYFLDFRIKKKELSIRDLPEYLKQELKIKNFLDDASGLIILRKH